MKITLFIVALILLGILFNRYEILRKNKKIETAFLGRERLSTEQFYEHFFKDQGIPFHIIEEIRKILSEQLDVDVSRLNDEDDFSKNLSFFWDFDSMADVELICALEEKFGIKISASEAENTRTIRDIVNLVFGKMKPQQALTSVKDSLQGQPIQADQ